MLWNMLFIIGIMMSMFGAIFAAKLFTDKYNVDKDKWYGLIAVIIGVIITCGSYNHMEKANNSNQILSKCCNFHKTTNYKYCPECGQLIDKLGFYQEMEIENMRKYDTEMEFKRRCYELYQLDWMRTHGYSLQDAFNMLRKGYAEGCASGNIDGGTGCDDDFDAMEEYFEEQGFGGEIFVCENEFYDCEYQDVGYMEYLLPKDMLEQYNSYQ